jgi:hypothetical protein
LVPFSHLPSGRELVGSAHCTRHFFRGITCNGENSSRFSVAPRRLRFLLRHRKRPPIASARLVQDFGQEPVRPDPCARAGAARLRARAKSSSRRLRGAKGDMHRVPQLLQEMRADKVEALVVNGFPVALATKTVGIATVVAFGAGGPVALVWCKVCPGRAATSLAYRTTRPNFPPSVCRCSSS